MAKTLMLMLGDLRTRLENRSRLREEADLRRKLTENPPPYLGGYGPALSFKRALSLLVMFLALPVTLLAHRLDEYLQATLVSIEPGEIRLRVNFTPGVAVAERVLSRIDRDHDGIIDANEAAAYAESVKHDLVIRLDQHEVGLKLIASNFPAPAELRTGWGIIQVEFSLTADSLTPGTHRLSLKNRHRPAPSVYLLNAAQPRSALVRIIRQKRNKNQSKGEIEFVLEPGPASQKR